MSAADKPEYLKVSEIAKRLDLVPMTVYRLIESGELAAYRFGKAYRIKTGDFDEYVRASKLGAAPVSAAESDRCPACGTARWTYIDTEADKRRIFCGRNHPLPETDQPPDDAQAEADDKDGSS